MNYTRLFSVVISLFFVACDVSGGNDESALLTSTWTNQLTVTGTVRTRSLVLSPEGEYSFSYQEVIDNKIVTGVLVNGIYTNSRKAITFRSSDNAVETYRYEISYQNGRFSLRLIGEGDKAGFYFK